MGSFVGPQIKLGFPGPYNTDFALGTFMPWLMVEIDCPNKLTIMREGGLKSFFYWKQLYQFRVGANLVISDGDR